MASERKFVAENIRRVLLKEYLMKEVSRAGFGGLDVQRTPMGTRVILTTERPGLVKPVSSSPPRGPGSSSEGADRPSRT